MKSGSKKIAKKLLLLGGSRYIMPLIETAHKLDIYVITCDYLPNNPAHKLSDEYWNISILNKEEILEVAQEAKIDGIISFACDPGVVTAAYVAEQMSLPFQCSYSNAMILQDKGLFREFLINKGFNSPNAKSYSDLENAKKDIDFYQWPVIVKPVDSAGSKGVTRVDRKEELEEAIEAALENSHSGKFVIEEFLEFDGYHSDADLFNIDGRLQFVTYSDQLFDSEADNPYTPAYIIWPSSMKVQYQQMLTNEIQRLMTLLEMKTGIYNVETCVANGKVYIMEISPRGGGCKIAELQKLAFGVDLIENEVRKAVGLPLKQIIDSKCDGYWCEMVIHSKPREYGKLQKISLDPEIQKKYLQLMDIGVEKGEFVKPFTGANMSLGDIFLKFDSRQELDEIMSKSKEWIYIDLKDEKY